MIFNHVKTFVILGVLTLLVLMLGFALGGTTGLTIALLFTIVMNVISFWYSDKIVLKMYKAQKASHTEYPKLNDMVKDLADRAGIKKPRVFIIPKDVPNAFATGRSQKVAAVAVTRGLFDLLDERELRGVLAHELGHIKNKDTLIQTVAVILASAIAYVAMIARWGAIFGSRDENSAGLFQILALSIVAPLAATILQLSISRSREYIADATGASLTKDPSALASALEKLENNPRKLREGNQATASMFIVNPFSGQNFMKLFSTHPPTHERIKRLRKLSMKEY